MSCSKRGDEASCTYSNAEKSARDRRDCGYKDSEAQLRLQRLEQMVTGLIQTNKAWSGGRNDNKILPNGPDNQMYDDISVDSSPQTSESSSKGRLNMNTSEKEYVNTTHWTTILENVSRPGLKKDIQRFINLARSEKSKTFWNTSRTIARTYQPRLLLNISILY